MIMDSWGITDKGIMRTQNQDAYYTFCDGAKGVAAFIVCDGMGGHQAGNVASEIAASVFVHEHRRVAEPEPTVEKARLVLDDIAEKANAMIFDLANSDARYSGMGTTMVSCAVVGGDAVVMNVGDSRAYMISDGRITQISKDHSVVEEMIDRGEITREESRSHPKKNLITRAVGTVKEIECDDFIFQLEEGDYILLCSDGLSNVVTDEEILRSVTDTETLEAACEALVRLALVRGAPDNVTIVLFRR